MSRFRHDPRLLAGLGDLAFRTVAATCRVRVVGGEAVRAAGRNAPGVIFALWHGRLLLGALAHRGRGTVVMISHHADGEIIARIVDRHGYRPVRGSSSRGGGDALKRMLELAAAGAREFAVTPDGPRGPRHRAQAGVVRLAAGSGCLVVPSSASARPGHFLDSWDRFLVPWPFSRVTVVYGEPLAVPSDLEDPDVEAWRRKIEAAMIAVEAEADRLAGWRW